MGTDKDEIKSLILRKGKDDEEERDSWTTTFDPTFAVKLVETSDPPLSWDDYIADEDVKGQLKRICANVEMESSDGTNGESFVKQILRTIRLSTRGSVSSPPATARQLVLFHGKPGCGKTQAVRVMANVTAKSTVQVYTVDLTVIKSTWYNQTAHQLKNVLKHIAKLKDAIVFIDEIDPFVGSNLRQDPHGAPLLMEFLQWVNGINTVANNTTIICATNCMALCDAAFLSRCSHKIEIPPPSQELRLQWWNAKARQLTPCNRKALAEYDVESFRSLEQLVDDAEETAAHTTGEAPCFENYLTRLHKIATVSSFQQGSGPPVPTTTAANPPVTTVTAAFVPITGAAGPTMSLPNDQIPTTVPSAAVIPGKQPPVQVVSPTSRVIVPLTGTEAHVPLTRTVHSTTAPAPASANMGPAALTPQDMARLHIGDSAAPTLAAGTASSRKALEHVFLEVMQLMPDSSISWHLDQVGILTMADILTLPESYFSRPLYYKRLSEKRPVKFGEANNFRCLIWFNNVNLLYNSTNPIDWDNVTSQQFNHFKSTHCQRISMDQTQIIHPPKYPIFKAAKEWIRWSKRA